MKSTRAARPVQRQGASRLFGSLLLLACLAAPGRSATIDWNLGAAGDWNVATNWMPAAIPGMGDAAVNDTSFTITDTGSNTVGSVSTLGNLDLSDSTFQVLGGVTLQSAATTVNVTGGTFLEFNGTQSVTGPGAVTFDSNSSNELTIEGTSTLTIGAGVAINGSTATIGYQRVTGGSNAIANNGTIGSSVSGGTFALYDDTGTMTITNNGTIQATNGGVTEFADTTALSGTGNLTTSGASSAIEFMGTTSATGTITASATDGAALNITSSGEVKADNLTINLTGALNNNDGILLSADSLTINGGTLNISGGGYLEFEQNTSTMANPSLNGPVTITFDSNSSNDLTVEGTSTLTIASNVMINGSTATIGYQRLLGGNNGIVNNGTIGSTVSGGTFAFYDENGTLTLTNNGTIQALNGGVTEFDDTVNLAGGALNASGSGSAINFNGTTNASGTITATAASGAALSITSGSRLATTGVTLNLTGTLTNDDGYLTSTSGLTVNGGTISDIAGGYIEFLNTQTLGGSTTITFDSNASNDLTVEGTSTLTVGSGVVIDGTTAYIGYQRVTGGSNAIVNNGTIGSSVSGGTFTFQDENGTLTLTNNGTIQALNGGSTYFDGAVDLAGGTLNANGSGSVIDFNGTTNASGTITATAANGASFNVIGDEHLNLTGVTLDLTGTLTNDASFLTSTSGLTVNGGTIADTAGGWIEILNTQTLGGSTTITFDSNSQNELTVEGTSTLTVGSGVVINGSTASIGYQRVTGGTNAIVNNGTIGSTVSGGTFTFYDQNGNMTLTNNGTILASSGGTTNVTTVEANFIQTGTVWAEAGSTVGVTNGYTQTGGATQADGILNAGGTGIVLSAGTLSGKGTVNGDVTNNGGTVIPGDKTGATFGTLTVNGAFTQGSGGTYLEQIGGTTSGSQYTTLALNSTMALDGPLDIQLLGGFVPAHDATFDIITGYTSRTGTFAGLVDVGGQQNWEINYLDGSKIVQLVATPAPDSLAVLGLGLSGLGGMLRMRHARKR
jgi:hypothetical protein